MWVCCSMSPVFLRNLRYFAESTIQYNKKEESHKITEIKDIYHGKQFHPRKYDRWKYSLIHLYCCSLILLSMILVVCTLNPQLYSLNQAWISRSCKNYTKKMSWSHSHITCLCLSWSHDSLLKLYHPKKDECVTYVDEGHERYEVLDEFGYPNCLRKSFSISMSSMYQKSCISRQRNRILTMLRTPHLIWSNSVITMFKSIPVVVLL